jgi:hypothetical protein
MSTLHSVAVTTSSAFDAGALVFAVSEALTNGTLGGNGHLQPVTPTLLAGQITHLDLPTLVDLLNAQEHQGEPIQWSLAYTTEDGHWQTVHSDDYGTEWSIAFQQVPGQWIVYDESFGVFATRQAAEDKRAIEGRRYSDGGDSAFRLVQRTAGQWAALNPETNLADVTQSQIHARNRRH